MTSLPSAFDLIRDAWRSFVSTWKQTIRVSGWLVPVGLAYPIILSAAKNAPRNAAAAIFALHLAALVAVAFWVSIRLMQVALQIDDGKKPDLSRATCAAAWRLAIPLFLLGLLQGLIVFGGFLLLVIPGIYLTVALFASQLFLVDKGMRGFQAVAASYELVKGRWAATFWRMLTAGVIFGVGSSLVIWVVQSALVSAAGVPGTQTDIQNPLLAGALLVVEFVFQAALAPLFVLFQVKLYHALQRTR